MTTSEYYHANKERIDLKNREWKQKHPEKTREINRRSMQKYKEKRKLQIYAWIATPDGKYSKYKHGATKRKIIFNLSLDEFKAFWQKPCVYCGDPIETIGLDRIDNEKGYQIDNIVSCCSVCNMMKNSYGKEFFVNHCKKIAERS